jgi:hypothetical protein
MNSMDFSTWLHQFAAETGIKNSLNIHEEKSILVHGVICTFVHPVGSKDDTAAVLLDAGKLEQPGDNDYLLMALGRNLENFLMGSPLFFINTESQHLVIGQQFQFAQVPPASFGSLLDSLALQAAAWQQKQR